ncbi:unnamed protein product [Didymodactylos carnosus]|nr:unnamed protein product [Didymodactylos carnosus]CAF4038836.1 unnamed protein product [Didymodactylos carnosus]
MLVSSSTRGSPLSLRKTTPMPYRTFFWHNYYTFAIAIAVAVMSILCCLKEFCASSTSNKQNDQKQKVVISTIDDIKKEYQLPSYEDATKVHLYNSMPDVHKV